MIVRITTALVSLALIAFGLFGIVNTTSAASQCPNGQTNCQAGRGGMMGHHGDMLDTVATTLGMDEATLKTELQAGKTIAEIAKAKGVDLAKVVDAVMAEHQTRVAAMVKAGTITQAQADTMTATMKANVTTHLTQVWTAKGPMGQGKGGAGMGKGSETSMMTVTAKLLNMTVTDLQTELKAGKSIADVAKAKGVDVNKIIDALVAERTAALAQQVKAGTITQAQADTMIAAMRTHITEHVNQAGFPGGKNGTTKPMQRGNGRGMHRTQP